MCEPSSTAQQSGKAPRCSGAAVEVPPAWLPRRRRPEPWPPPARPLGSRSPSGIPLALWGAARPPLTPSLGHVSPSGGARRALPAEPRARGHAPLLQQTWGCCLGTRWDFPAPGIGPSFGVHKGDGYSMGAHSSCPRGHMLPGSPWAQELTGGRSRVGSPTQNTRPHRSPQPRRSGSAQRARGARGRGTGTERTRPAAHRELPPSGTAGAAADNPETKLAVARMITSTLNEVRDVGRLPFPFLPSFAGEPTSLHSLFPPH